MEHNPDSSESLATADVDTATSLCLLAGKIMLQSGAETSRVEDTMTRMAASLGIPLSHSYVTPTGIIFQAGSEASSKLIRIAERTTDLQKVTAVNSVSRRLTNGTIQAAEAKQELLGIDRAAHAFPVWVLIAAASIASASFTIMFQGDWRDLIPSFISGGIGYSAVVYFHRLVKVKFFAELFAAFLVGLVSMLLVQSGIGAQLDKIIIGSVMPLVPGLLITNAVRDLMAGHLVSGLSRGAEAFLTAFAIGTGIAVLFIFF
ncbi:threonine/serine exporter family protein [Paenibacillus sp. YPG26]|uniref:threonine/serine exporter family protein n=1 Tax=Paenibacillus sp. YPG26 TaxID=2878915 RepID=UPI00218A8A14|nr:threonine/serine exporter family protein [Paenibacillus sp. YPG26]